jgi:tetratricopeptide (TPR) repeat protein
MTTDLEAQAHQAFQTAVAFHRTGQLQEAQQRFQETLRLQPTHVQAMVLLAVVLLALDRPEDALGLARQALLIDPHCIAAHVTAGQANSHLDRSTAAIACFDHALAINPQLANVHLRRGSELHKIGSCEAALQSFDRAIACNAAFAAAHYNRGVTLSGLRRHSEALASFDRAIGIQPGYVDAHVNRGVALTNLGEPDAALASYDRALALQSDHALALVNRGQVLAQLQRLDEAIASCDRAIEFAPDHADAYVNRGVALAYLKHWERAVASYDKAIELQPDHVRAHVNRSIALLSAGNFADGWAAFEWRLKEYDESLGWPGSYSRPIWRGDESLAGKSILLYGESGLGDTIQFCRYARLVADLGAEVLLHVQHPLASLLGSLGAGVHMVTHDAHLPDVDYCCPLMSLPLAFQTTLSSIPARVPYLHGDPEKILYWKEKLGARRKRRVGLVWSGGFRPNQPQLWSIDRRRNIPLEMLSSLQHPDVEFYSLQKGQPAESELTRLMSVGWAGPQLIDHTALLHDFSDTAALIENLDLVICVDTSTAHLAAALGKPTWILNRYDSCWRWLSDRDDSPWYPTVRLYRQELPGDWSGVVARIRRDLTAGFLS